MNLDDTQLLIVLLFVLIAVLVAWIVRLESRLKKLLGGAKKDSLESSIVSLKNTEEDFKAFKSHLESTLSHIEKKLKKSIKHVDTLRFDPFKGASGGGNQSFATAFLDEDGNGVVISTIHTRDRVGIYSKPLKGGVSEFELTEEEQQVIQNAQKS